MNQRGWLRVVEAVFAVLLVAGVLLFFISNQNPSSDLSETFYSMQLDILRQIETDASLREDILKLEPDLRSGIFVVPSSVESYIDSSLPLGYECVSKICFLNHVCNIESSFFSDKGEVFSQGVAITANREIYSPKQLKLFCWLKK